jgi:NADPH:quinone reductase-like Zn-dependent oxidoreductase
MADSSAADTMTAVVRDRFGSADVLEVKTVPRPELPPDGVLVRVRAASLNRADWYEMTGRPYLARPMTGLRGPKSPAVGFDFAGVVEGAGSQVDDLAPGDEVFGARKGAFAEYVAVREGVARKPTGLSFEEAAAVPIAGVTALQGLRDKAGVTAGQHVLINGASGGVGTFAVQVAKALGAEVTAVCNTNNVDLAKALGADHVIDYSHADFTRSGEHYDVVFDIAGNRSWLACRRVLSPRGVVVLVGGPSNRLVGPLGHVAVMSAAGMVSRRKVAFFIADVTRRDLETLVTMMTNGAVKAVVDKRFPLGSISEAMRYLGSAHPRGKVVVTV